MHLLTLWVLNFTNHVSAVYRISYATFKLVSLQSNGSSTISVPTLYVRLIWRGLPFPTKGQWGLGPVVVYPECAFSPTS
jgi:hypothetical protein